MDYKTFEIIAIDYCKQVAYNPKDICDKDAFHNFMIKQMNGYPASPDGVKKKLQELHEYEARFNNAYINGPSFQLTTRNNE